MKRHIKTRILSLLLAAVLASGNISPTVFAAPENVSVEDTAEIVDVEEEEVEEPETENGEETAEPETGSGEEAEEPENGSGEEAAEPETGSGEEVTEPETGNGEEAAEPETGSGEEVTEPETGSGEEAEESDTGSREEATEPETGNGEEATEPETGTGEEATEPETGNGEEVTEPETEIGNETENPAESDIIDELLTSEPFEKLPEKLSEAIECTCDSQEEDALLHSWDCPVFQEEFLELCDCGEESEQLTEHDYGCAGVLKAFAALCDDECGAYENPAAAHHCKVQARLLEALCSCESESEDFSEHSEECGYYQYMLVSVRELYGVSMTATYEPPNRKQNGYPLTDNAHVSGWTLKTSGFSSDYKPILFRDGISSMSLWVDPGASVKTWTRTIGNYKCMHPANDSVSTKRHFGALYSKVVYDGQQWYDMKVTVVDYSNTVTSNDGTKVTARPGITFATDRIAFQTSQKVGAVRVRVEFFKTGTNTRANLNIRFQWRDIDDSQRFGFALGDGSVVEKYYYDKDTTVKCSSKKEIAGMDMEVLVGHWNHVGDELDSKTRIAYELSNCSTFYIGFGPEDNIGNTDRQIVYTTAFYREGEKALKAGKDEVTVDRDGDGKKETTTTINDLLVMTDSTAIIDTPAPTKYVSNDGSGWNSSNILPTTTSEYYYMIRQEVPWQDTGYRYESFSITDSLPAGADYVSLVGITDEGGRNKSGLFDFSGANDVVTLTAKNASDGDFVGHWYTIIFKVKMDPTEITPSYSRTKASYSVINKASVSYKHPKNRIQTKDSNSVTTTASASAPSVPAPTKSVSNDGKTWDTSNTLATPASEYYYRVIQQIPSAEYAYRYEKFTLRDSLPAGADYVSLSSIKNENGDDKSSLFNVSAADDVITATVKNLSDSSFAGHWYTFMFKVKMDPAEITPSYSGNSALYEIKNTASVTTKNVGLTQEDQDTNTVTTKASSTRPTQEAPGKGINKDRNLTAYDMKSAAEKVVFSIFQKVPAYDALWEPCTITVTDVLEDCLQYEGCTVNLDGTALSSGWKASENGQTVTVTGRNQSQYGGKTLRFDITCKLKDGYDLSSYEKVIDGDIVATIPNEAKVKFAWEHASEEEKETNRVNVKIKKNAVNLVIHKTSKDTAESIPGAVFTVYEWDGKAYSIGRGTMNYDASGKVYRMDRLIRTASNAGKFKVAESGVPYGYAGNWEKEFIVSEIEGGGTRELSYNVTNDLQKCRIHICKENEAGDRLEGAVFEISADEDIVSPQGKVLVKAGTVVDTMTSDKDGKAVSKELYIGQYLVKETKAPVGYDMGDEWIAAVFSYSPGTKEGKVEESTVTFRNPMKNVHLSITKEIDTEDIVWAHGNPTFLFKVDGTDLCGNSHTYYEAVEFTSANVGAGEKSTLTAEFTMPSGTYQVTEEKTMRYDLESIHSITGGSLEGKDTVVFDLSKGTDGVATFYNGKTTDERLSHTVFVRNIMKE